MPESNESKPESAISDGATTVSLFVTGEPRATYPIDIYAVDEYVATVPGDPYRLLPFGKLVKGGISHDITPEYAALFKIPHFSPPIKLGSHGETTPAGGTIARLEVRTTGEKPGLYAFPEFTPQGLKAIENGEYRYQSPEIVWENGAFENPQTGELMEGPFIVGDALLHVPHLGQAAAMYSFEPIYKGANMEQEKIEVPKDLWDKLGALFGKKTETPAAVVEPVDPEKFAAVVQQRDEMTARLTALEAEKAKAVQIDAMTAEIKEKKYGLLFQEDKFAAEAAQVFNAIPEEPRKWVLQKFAALSAQVQYSKLLGEFGQTGNETETDPKQAFTAVIAEIIKEKKVDYAAAFHLARAEHPDMAEAYDAAVSKKLISKESV